MVELSALAWFGGRVRRIDGEQTFLAVAGVHLECFLGSEDVEFYAGPVRPDGSHRLK